MLTNRNSRKKRSGPIRRTLKILAWLIGLLIVVCVIGAIALVLFFDPNDYKGRIEDTLTSQIGRRVQIRSEIHWSFYPSLEIALGRVTVANAKGVGNKPMASIKSAAASVQLLPLLGGDIKIGEVSLQGLTLRLTRRANGQSNYKAVLDHLTGSGSQSAQASGGAGNSGSQSSGNSFIESLSIQSIAVENAKVRYRSAGTTYFLKDFSLHTSAIRLDQPFELSLGARLEMPERKLAARLDASAQIEPHLRASRYGINSLHAEFVASGPGIPKGKQRATLNGKATLDLGAGTFELASTTLDVAGLSARLGLHVKQLTSSPHFEGSITVPQFDPRATLAQLGMSVGDQVSGEVLNSAQLSAQFQGSRQKLSLKPIKASLDATKVTGSATANLAASSYGFNLAVNKINLDRYGLSSGSGGGSGAAGSQAQKPKKFDLSFLRGLDVNGHTTIETLIAKGLTIHNAEVRITIDDGVLRVKPLQADLYGGHLKATARVDASQSTPHYRTDLNLSSVAFQPLLKDLMGLDRFSGVGDFKLQMASVGNTIKAIKRHLNGETQLQFAKGQLHGIDVREGLAAVMHGQSFRKALAASKSTVFHRLRAAFSVKNGVVHSNGLRMTTEAVNVRGDGQYDLPENELDYTVVLNVPENASGVLEKIAGLSIPVQLSGPLMSPSIGVDLQKLIRARLQNKVQERADQLKQSLGERLRQELGGGSAKDADKQGDTGAQSGEPEAKLKEELSHLFGN